jgi:hypothetical protein
VGVVLTVYEELENEEDDVDEETEEDEDAAADDDDKEVEVDEVVVAGGGVYNGQAVLVGLHWVMVTVAVMYIVLVVVCATADKALTAKTRRYELCIFESCC